MKKLLAYALYGCLGAACGVGQLPSKTTHVATNLDTVAQLTICMNKAWRGQAFDDALPKTITSLADLSQMRSEVWKAWRQFNAGLDEEKLPALKSLSEVDSAMWSIPDSLEPRATMPFFYGSKGNRPSTGYPLFLYLHGSGDKHREWETGLTLCNAFVDAPSVYFIPQIPNMGPYYRWWQKGKTYLWNRLLRQALASGTVDADRIYFFGISEGGYGSQRLASFYADYLAGAGPMAGGEPLRNAPAENCRHIAFSLRTGAKDTGFYRNLLTGYVKEEFERLQARYQGEFKHNIELIPDAGHSIDYFPTTPWLSQFRRKACPKAFSWENLDLDGVYRKGFYNVRIDQEPKLEDGKRMFYEMSIEGNRVDMTVSRVAYTTTETDPHWGIQLKFVKAYAPATEGRFTLFLAPELVDLNKPVEIYVNKTLKFKGKLTPTWKRLVESCVLFGDPRRLFPTAVEVTF